MPHAASHGGDAVDAAMKKEYAGDAEQRASDGPPARLKKATSLLFNTDAPGALMLYGLRNKVGEPTFRKIETTFFRTYQGRSAGTQDYIDVANRVSGQDLTPYFKAWLYGTPHPPHARPPGLEVNPNRLTELTPNNTKAQPGKSPGLGLDHWSG
ncbi:hypothetical protein [Streptomyces sp. CA-132043]|uniref:hypothetical protein n=1 Tax=Streptomyces sp. CA-132043 TaxID=3240048 RepID=UPI003D8E6181